MKSGDEDLFRLKSYGFARNGVGAETAGKIVEIEMLMLRKVVVGGMKTAGVVAGMAGMGGRGCSCGEITRVDEVAVVAVVMAVKLDDHTRAKRETQCQTNDNAPERGPAGLRYMFVIKTRHCNGRMIVADVQNY